MSGFSLATPEQVSQSLAARVKALRLARGWKQVTLAQRSGVSLASLHPQTRARHSAMGELVCFRLIGRLPASGCDVCDGVP